MLRASNVPGRIWVQFRIEDDYMEKEIDLRRLVIKAFHITEVEEGGENKVTASGKMTIEKKILDEKYRPEAALNALQQEGEQMCISVRTLYRYIDDGIFLKLTNAHLPVKGKAKKKEKQKPQWSTNRIICVYHRQNGKEKNV